MEQRVILESTHISIPVILAALGIIGLALPAYYVRTDYGAMGIALIFCLYVFRGRFIPRDISAGLLLCSFGPYEIWGLPAILLFHAYNGERGKQPKWLIYIFYPAHLLVLGLLRMYVF